VPFYVAYKVQEIRTDIMNCHGNADNTVVLHLTRQCLIVSLQYQNQKVIGVADVGVRIE